MRIPVALCAALGLVFVAHLASAETPASASPEPKAAPAPATPTPAIPPPATPAAAPAAAPGAAPGTTTPAEEAGPVVVPADNEQPPLEPIPNAHDTLGGHFVLGAAVGPRWPFGDLSSTRNEQDYMGAALAVNLDAGYGLSRNVVVGAWGEFDNHYAPSGCKACSATSLAVGPFVRYHLVQGTRFDPWGSFGLGYRAISVDTGPSTLHYYGWDFLRLTVGGDWYPTSNFGIGPYFTFDAGTYGSHVHTGLSTGLRLVFDLPGK
ncbi:MAG TPA: hypothetical protein VER96_26830 [Polyangiaceae bacterium]|nr:hypothetical protein [Polyangiaceae bacterium]